MATYTDFEVWYYGKAPLGIMYIVRNEMTVRGLLTVGLVSPDSVHIQANRFNDEYYDEMKELIEEYAKKNKGQYEIHELTECKLSFEWIYQEGEE